MSLWGNIDASNNAPIFAGTEGMKLTANSQALFGNTTFATTDSILGIIGTAIGVFGVDAVEQGVAVGLANSGAHAGWIVRTEGTGGRAGRITSETLVAMGSMQFDAADDTTLPDA
jgi:hypothetical protein